MNTDFKCRGSRGEIWLYDPVGSSFFGDAISAKMFQRELTALGKVDSISLHINSPGGDVFDGLAIYNMLKTHPAQVVVDIDGLAASIASIISMSGDTIRMAENAMMMIHDPQGFAMGNATEMQRTAALLDTVKGNLVDTYHSRTGQAKESIGAWMTDETWMTSDACMANGFCDSVAANTKVNAYFDLSNFHNVPAKLRHVSQNTVPTPTLDKMRVGIVSQGQRVAALCLP
jgi:ATP-dependent Clp endopeptidase proteolytic subunit ClpP